MITTTPYRPTLQQRRQAVFDRLLATYRFGDDLTITGEGFALHRLHHVWRATLTASTPTGPRAICFEVIFPPRDAVPLQIQAIDADTHQPMGHPG